MNEQVMEAVTPFLQRVKKSGGPNIIAICPFHEDPSTSTPSFSLNTDNGLWQCFGCGRTGNLRTLLIAMKVPKARIDLIVGPIQQTAKRLQRESRRAWKARFGQKNLFDAPTVLPESLLGLYDYAPVKLLDEGFDEDLIRKIGIGYDKRLRRITFPLRDLEGHLIGISGRTTQRNVEPRYRVYQGGYQGKDGEWVDGDFGPEFDEMFRGYKLNSRNFLWNAHRAWNFLKTAPRGTPLIITEGYKACTWVEQHGWSNVTATQGTSISGAQIDVVNHISDGPPLLLLDGDGPGMVGRWKIGQKLRKSRAVVLIGALSNETAPDDNSLLQLRESIENPKRLERWLKDEWVKHCQENDVNVDRPLGARTPGARGAEFGTGQDSMEFRKRGSSDFLL